MAKKKKVVKEVKIINPIESADEVRKTIETLEILPVIESKEDSIIVSEFEEVIGINSAEQLQKSGRQLVSVSMTSKGKLYKFKKGN